MTNWNNSRRSSGAQSRRRPNEPVDVAGQIGVIILIAGLACFIMRRRSAAARYIVWLAAMLGVLLLPLGALLPARQRRWLDWQSTRSQRRNRPPRFVPHHLDAVVERRIAHSAHSAVPSTQESSGDHCRISPVETRERLRSAYRERIGHAGCLGSRPQANVVARFGR